MKPAPQELPGVEPEKKAPRSVFELLRARYEGPAWAFLEEVRNGTGFTRKTVRTADAIAMGLWPSRGLHMHGFEVKVSRADWVRERDDPAKADEIAKYCHFWWLVIADPKIVQAGELPATWGLLVQHGDKLKAEKEPTFNKDATAPDHSFVAAILRKVQGVTPHALIERARLEGHNAGVAEGRQWVLDHDTTASTQRAWEDLKANVDAFEKASGIGLSYQHLDKVKKLGGALRLLTNEWSSPLRSLLSIEKSIERMTKEWRAVRQEIEREVPAIRDGDEVVE